MKTLFILIPLFFFSCSNFFEPEIYNVEYKITGTASTVDVTLNNSTGGTEQFSNVPLPVTYTYNDFKDWFLYISAQNQGTSGSVTVSIYVNDDLKKSSTSSGAYVIATASDTLDIE